MYKCLLIALVFFSVHVHGFDFDGGRMDIPKGFEGPISRELGKGIFSWGFTFPHEDNTAAVLQLTIWNVPDDLSKIPANKIKIETEKYLIHFLQGVANNKTNYVQGKIEFMQISNQLVAKVIWQGLKEGYGTHGSMYCLIYNAKVYIFHAQDYSEYKNKYANLAVKAIENMEFKK